MASFGKSWRRALRRSNSSMARGPEGTPSGSVWAWVIWPSRLTSSGLIPIRGLPSGERGPVDWAALARLAASCFSETGFWGCDTRVPSDLSYSMGGGGQSEIGGGKWWEGKELYCWSLGERDWGMRFNAETRRHRDQRRVQCHGGPPWWNGMGNPEECPQECGHGSLKGYATVLRRRINECGWVSGEKSTEKLEVRGRIPALAALGSGERGGRSPSFARNWSFYIFHQICFDSITPAGEPPTPFCVCLY
jgi:hypothetical protein